MSFEEIREKLKEEREETKRSLSIQKIEKKFDIFEALCWGSILSSIVGPSVK